MTEQDNELGFLNEYEDMPDFDEVTLPEEEATEGPESSEVEEDTTEPAESAESATQAPKKEEKLSPYESAILEEMKRRATSDSLLASGLASKDKDIKGCFAYVKEQARKRAVAGCAMIEDKEVFGWAVHYYTESKEEIDKELAPKPAKKAVIDKAVKKIKANPLLASLMEKKGFKPTEEGAVTKTSHLANGNTKEVKVTDKTKVTTIKGKGGSLTFTELSLF